MTFIKEATQRKVVIEHFLTKGVSSHPITITLYRMDTTCAWQLSMKGLGHMEGDEFHVCSLYYLHEILTDATKALEAYNKQKALEAQLDMTPL